MRHFRILLLAYTLLAASCATPRPPFLREPLPDNPSLTQVNADANAYAGRKTRWGGAIVRVENRAQETWIEIVERPLDAQGQPSLADQSGGRFIARVATFLDPLIYTQGRDITVTGILDGTHSGNIGDYEYRYPIVKTDTVFLWPKDRPLRAPPPPDPYWYDPWYPYWPWWYRPYYY